MASRNISLYISDRTFSAVRGREPVSARVNQIADRYLELIQGDGPGLRKLFNDDEWTRLVEAWAMLAFEKLPAIAARPSLARAFEADDAVRKTINEMTAADFFILVELLEAAEIEAAAARPPATQS